MQFRPKPHFRARLTFTFEEARPSYNSFIFGESGHRRVPIQMDGVEGLNTLAMYIDGAAEFEQGDVVEIDCLVGWPEGFHQAVKPGVRFKLWDGGFFAEGEVTERFDDSW